MGGIPRVLLAIFLIVRHEYVVGRAATCKIDQRKAQTTVGPMKLTSTRWATPAQENNGTQSPKGAHRTFES